MFLEAKKAYFALQNHAFQKAAESDPAQQTIVKISKNKWH